MSNSAFPAPDLEDIIFEGRNKAYGAFLLRRIYSDHVLKACLTAILSFSFFIFGPIIFENLQSGNEELVEEVTIVDPKMIEPPPIDPKTPPPPPLPAAPPPPMVSTVRFVPPEVAPDEEILEEDPPKQEELKEAVAAVETVVGDPSADPNELVMDENTGAGEVIGAPEEENDEAFLAVEEMPAFPDGDVQVFFAKNLRYTQKALNNDVSGKVFISFIVNKDGSISEISIMKGLGYGLDEEALRVVKMMPKWLPGKQGGRAVRVKIIQPIKFSL
jgi:protein TonB